jgi:hypothetical protein
MLAHVCTLLVSKNETLDFSSYYWQYPGQNEAQKLCRHKLFNGIVDICDKCGKQSSTVLWKVTSFILVNE